MTRLQAARDYYAILGVGRSATPREIKSAYRRLSRQHHPDYNTAPDANARMAELNEAYAVLSDPLRRTAFDAEHTRVPRRAPGGGLRREPPAAANRPPAKPPAEGRGAPQPDRLPDWYAFLGVYDTASSAEVLAALRRLRNDVEAANYAEDDDALLHRQLRDAADTLLTPAHRAVYDRALSGTPPRPGQYPQFHAHWYSFLGVSPRAPLDRIATAVTDLTGRMRRNSPEYQEVEAAWRTFRDPKARAEYDASLAEPANR